MVTGKAGWPASPLHAVPSGAAPHPQQALRTHVHSPQLSGKEAEAPRSSWTGWPPSGKGQGPGGAPFSPHWAAALWPCSPHHPCHHPGKGELCDEPLVQEKQLHAFPWGFTHSQTPAGTPKGGPSQGKDKAVVSVPFQLIIRNRKELDAKPVPVKM